jgi:hypothetical protein
MQERYLGRIVPDLDVCDAEGERVGTVAQVYRYDLAVVGGAQEAQRPREEMVEVKTGLLGLGKHFYIPLSAIQDVTQGCLFLSHRREDFEGLGWHDKPTYLGELR